MILASAGEKEAQLEPSYPAGGNAKGTVDSENHPSGSLNAKHMLTIHTSNPIPGKHAREIKMLVHTKTQTQMFVAALFKSAVNRKRASVPGPVRESAAEQWGESSARERNKLRTPAMLWEKLGHAQALLKAARHKATALCTSP